MQQFFIAIILVLGLGCYWLYNENQTLTANNFKLELAVEEQKETMKVMQENFEKQGKALQNLSRKNAEIEADKDKYLAILSKHNFEKLAIAKPGLMEIRFNKGTDEVLRELENDTKEKIDNVKSVHDHLETYDFVGKVLSLASIIRTAEKLNSNEEFDTLELSVLYKKLPQDIKDQILKPYVLIDKNQARISLRVIDTHPELKRANFVNELREHMESNYNNQNIEVSLTGILILYNNMLQSLFDSQIKSLGIVLMGIFIILIILFRSFKIALAALIPNLVACFVILGTMGLLNIPLDLMTITIASITIGIAVDNCIHYVYRYREYIAITGSHTDAVNNCQKTVSTAIKNTSITIMAGFSILVFSNFYPTIYFGAFTALAMFIALVGSLTILPILLGYFNKNS